jgi:hypothetical protein
MCIVRNGVAASLREAAVAADTGEAEIPFRVKIISFFSTCECLNRWIGSFVQKFYRKKRGLGAGAAAEGPHPKHEMPSMKLKSPCIF